MRNPGDLGLKFVLFTRLTVLSFSLAIFSPLSHVTLFSFPFTSVSAFLMNSVKSCFQNMEICKRRVNMYDTVNQSKTPFITHVAPSTSTNLTMTFNNQLNTVHNQVSGEQRRPAGWQHQELYFPTKPSQKTEFLYCHIQPCKKVFVSRLFPLRPDTLSVYWGPHWTSRMQLTKEVVSEMVPLSTSLYPDGEE